jgi:hypothetical protein
MVSERSRDPTCLIGFVSAGVVGGRGVGVVSCHGVIGVRYGGTDSGRWRARRWERPGAWSAAYDASPCCGRALTGYRAPAIMIRCQ